MHACACMRASGVLTFLCLYVCVCLCLYLCFFFFLSSVRACVVSRGVAWGACVFKVGMTAPWMAAYVRLLIRTCHRRGVHAMGGMAAQIPIKEDAAKNSQVRA